MGDLRGPGPEPVSPALAGGFLTTAPRGKSLSFILHLQSTYHKSNENVPFFFVFNIFLIFTDTQKIAGRSISHYLIDINSIIQLD